MCPTPKLDNPLFWLEQEEICELGVLPTFKLLKPTSARFTPRTTVQICKMTSQKFLISFSADCDMHEVSPRREQTLFHLNSLYKIYLRFFSGEPPSQPSSRYHSVSIWAWGLKRFSSSANGHLAESRTNVWVEMSPERAPSSRDVV